MSQDQDEKQRRKERPIARGVVNYFPDALAEVAHVSLKANEQHNPGQPMHWSYGKSADHADCIVRHLVDAGTIDDDGLSHTAKVAWRALALLQTEIESRDPALHARRQAARDLIASSQDALVRTLVVGPRPSVGEEVSRDVAWADMRAHPKARYSTFSSPFGVASRTSVFLCVDKVQELLPGGKSFESEDAYHGWTFTRLEDAP